MPLEAERPTSARRYPQAVSASRKSSAHVAAVVCESAESSTFLPFQPIYFTT